MIRPVQTVLLWLYARVQKTRLLTSGPGRAVFEWFYEFYKTRLEAAGVDHLRALVTPGSTVIDVGANVGFFTHRFARWAGDAGKVIAIEPELQNFQRLKRRLTRLNLIGTVDLVHAAAAESSGRVYLGINSQHPGDHRLAEAGVEVASVSIDDVLAARSWPRVSLIKIDVQGAEERVLRGARQTLEKIRPTWFVEIDDGHLKSMGSSAAAVLTRFTAAGYTIHRVTRGGIGAPLEGAQVLAGLKPGHYEDLLFKP